MNVVTTAQTMATSSVAGPLNSADRENLAAYETVRSQSGQETFIQVGATSVEKCDLHRHQMSVA